MRTMSLGEIGFRDSISTRDEEFISALLCMKLLFDLTESKSSFVLCSFTSLIHKQALNETLFDCAS